MLKVTTFLLKLQTNMLKVLTFILKLNKYNSYIHK